MTTNLVKPEMNDVEGGYAGGIEDVRSGKTALVLPIKPMMEAIEVLEDVRCCSRAGHVPQEVIHSHPRKDYHDVELGKRGREEGKENEDPYSVTHESDKKPSRVIRFGRASDDSTKGTTPDPRNVRRKHQK